MSLKRVNVFQIGKDSVQSIAVNGATTVYSDPIFIDIAEYFSCFYQASSGGTIDLDVQLQVSRNNTTWVTPDDISPIHTNLDDSNEHNKRIAVNRAPYVRFAITGGASNAATTKVKIWLSV